MKEDNTNINLVIESTLKEQLKKEAKQRDMSVSALIRVIIREHFKKA